MRFIDYDGVPSNYSYFTLVNEQYTETTKLMIAPTADNSDPVHNPGLITTVPEKTTKTTTERTTKEKTTKATTAKATTTKKPQNTTTKKSETAKTSKIKEETQGATVYYYEKEVIISQVYVTQTEQETAATQTTTEEQTLTAAETTSIPLSVGSKYKAIAGVICAASFIAVAAWSVIGAKKDKNEDETENSEQ